MLEDLLFRDPASSSEARSRGAMIAAELLFFDAARIRAAMASLSKGEHFVYAVPLDTAIPRRLLTMAILRLRLRRAERAIVRAGARVIGRYGIDPNLTTPSCVFELGTAASAYARRYLRPRGRAPALRQWAGWWLGCDPALGAVVIVARKS